MKKKNVLTVSLAVILIQQIVLAMDICRWVLARGGVSGVAVGSQTVRSFLAILRVFTLFLTHATAVNVSLVRIFYIVGT
jgi:hypothetical protein